MKMRLKLALQRKLSNDTDDDEFSELVEWIRKQCDKPSSYWYAEKQLRFYLIGNPLTMPWHSANCVLIDLNGVKVFIGVDV